MTRRYSLTLNLKADDGTQPVAVHIANKTMDTIQQIVRLAMSDFEKTEKRVSKLKPHGPIRIDPPIEIIEEVPTLEDIEAINRSENA